MENFNLSETELLYRYSSPVFAGFTGVSCEDCETTVNLVKGLADFDCRCGKKIYLPTRSFSKPHQQPDFGPNLEQIQGAANKALKGKLQERLEMLKEERDQAAAEQDKAAAKRKRKK